jgi:hypothetical protein
MCLARGAFLQALQSHRVDGVQRIERRLVVDAQILGDARGAFPAGAGQEDLAAAQDEGIHGAKTPVQRCTLRLAQRACKDGRSHADQRTTFSFTHLAKALGRTPCTSLPTTNRLIDRTGLVQLSICEAPPRSSGHQAQPQQIEPNMVCVFPRSRSHPALVYAIEA